MGRDSSKKKIIVGAVIAILFVFIAVVTIVVLYVSKNISSELKSTYLMEIQSGDSDSTIFRYIFEDGNYTEMIGVGDKEYQLDSGSYTVKDDEVVCVSAGENSRTESFVIAGEYLLAKDYIYEGVIPEGKTFSAKCTFASDTSDSSVDFSEDGTFVYTSSSSGIVSGTYERKGDFISLNASNGASLIDFIVWNNRITNAYYIAE